ncbi:MAG: CPCC family cysteine-rich protein [Halorientalis sp.]
MVEWVTREGYCPVCGYRTLPSHPHQVRYEICPICYWEDDLVQQSKPKSPAGANKIPLQQARENFRKYGAVERRLVEYTREPTDDDDRDPDWPYTER